MSARIAVDRIRCDGRGVCAELFPEMITLDEWGYPVVGASSIPDHLLPMAKLAVSSCPVMALRLAADARVATPQSQVFHSRGSRCRKAT